MPILMRAGDADGAYDEPHAVFLASKCVLHRRAHRGSLRIGPGNALGHRVARRLLLVDVALEHAFGEERVVLLRPVCGVGPDA